MAINHLTHISTDPLVRLHNAAAAAEIHARALDPDWIEHFDDRDPMSIDVDMDHLLELAAGAPEGFWTGFLYCSYLARVQMSEITGRAFG